MFTAPLRILRFRTRWSSRLDRSSGRRVPIDRHPVRKPDQFVATVGHSVMSADPVVTWIFIVVIIKLLRQSLGVFPLRMEAIERPFRIG